MPPVLQAIVALLQVALANAPTIEKDAVLLVKEIEALGNQLLSKHEITGQSIAQAAVAVLPPTPPAVGGVTGTNA
jgi:hypothetical protein